MVRLKLNIDFDSLKLLLDLCGSALMLQSFVTIVESIRDGVKKRPSKRVRCDKFWMSKHTTGFNAFNQLEQVHLARAPVAKIHVYGLLIHAGIVASTVCITHALEKC